MGVTLIYIVCCFDAYLTVSCSCRIFIVVAAVRAFDLGGLFQSFWRGLAWRVLVGSRSCVRRQSCGRWRNRGALAELPINRKKAYTVVVEGPIEPTQLTPREAFAEAEEVRACCRPGCFGSISVHRTKTTCSSFSVQTMHSDFYVAVAVPHRGLGFRRILLALPTTSD